MRFRQNKTKQSRTNRERKKDLMIVMIVAHYNHNRNNKNNSNNNSNQSFSYEDHCQFHIQKVCYLYSPIFFLYIHSPLLLENKSFHNKLDHRPMFNYITRVSLCEDWFQYNEYISATHCL